MTLALSNHLPLYGRIDTKIAEIPQAEVRTGMFWGGATRFEIPSEAGTRLAAFAA